MILADDALRRLIYSSEPVLLLFSDREEGLAAARAAAERVGCRIADACGMDGAPARFDAQAGAQAVLVSAAAPSADLDGLLERMSRAARAGATKGIVVAPVAMIDAVAGDLNVEIEHLIDPSDDELELAIAAATAPTSASVRDVNRRGGLTVLQQLSEDAAKIAAALASLTEDEAAGGDAGEEGEQAPGVDAGFVRAIIRARRLRDQYFRDEIFADPAFDVLLDLYAARLEDSRVAVSSLCIAAAVPATTALRWIKQLTDKGLLVRSADPADGRRVYIGLSDDAARAMERYLGEVQRGGLPAI